MFDHVNLPTAFSNLTVATLTAENAPAYYALVDRNRRHLTRLGDYRSMLTATPESVIEELSEASFNLITGLWFDERLIGRLDLVPKAPGVFVIGYWLDEAAQGHGYMTAACRAVLRYAARHLDAEAVYAGVTKGNDRSVALLTRLGFHFVADMGTYNRYRLDRPDAPDQL